MERELRLADPGEGIHEAEIVDVLVSEGDRVEEEQSILVIETDKVSTEVPSPFAGIVKEIKVAKGDTVKVGKVLMVFEVEAEEGEEEEAEPKREEARKETEEVEPEEPETEKKERAEEKEKKPAGKKAEREEAEAPKPERREKPREPKAEDEKERAGKKPGRKRPVPAVPSTRRAARELCVDLYEVEPSGPGGRVTAEDVKAYAEKAKGKSEEKPEKKPPEEKKKEKSPEKEKWREPAEEEAEEIVETSAFPEFGQWGEVERVPLRSAGSYPVPLPGTEFKEGGRIMSSTGALDLADVPERLLVVGGGYVGVELGAVYASLGSKVTLVKMADRLMMPHADKELVDILARELTGMFDSIHYKTSVNKMEETEKEVEVVFEGDMDKKEGTFDRALVAVGRKPASGDLGLGNTDVEIDGKGYIKVGDKLRTADKKIFAIGDVAGGAMLAHKALYEGKIAAEVIAKKTAAFDARAIPAVVYTFPQLAWCGLMEKEAKEQGMKIKVGRFPWSASGRAASMGSPKGLTKMIMDAETGQVLGVGIVGREAGEMISEGVLAVEMGALAEDVALSMHPHPTLSETEEEAAEAFLGSSTHILS